MLHLVSLTNCTSTNVILNDLVGILHMEITAKTMQCALNALMAVVVSGGEDSLEQGGIRPAQTAFC